MRTPSDHCFPRHDATTLLLIQLLSMLNMGNFESWLTRFSPFASFSRVLQGICGMSVVKDWETLKKFNLAQLQEVKTDKKQGGGSKSVTSAAPETTVTPAPVVEVPAEKS